VARASDNVASDAMRSMKCPVAGRGDRGSVVGLAARREEPADEVLRSKGRLSRGPWVANTDASAHLRPTFTDTAVLGPEALPAPSTATTA